MRIVSLLPSATEIVCALGLRDELVGVTHECDWPPEVVGLPVMTSNALDLVGATSREINVRDCASKSSGVATSVEVSITSGSPSPVGGCGRRATSIASRRAIATIQAIGADCAGSNSPALLQICR